MNINKINKVKKLNKILKRNNIIIKELEKQFKDEITLLMLETLKKTNKVVFEGADRTGGYVTI